jgi:hypothetical protein
MTLKRTSDFVQTFNKKIKTITPVRSTSILGPDMIFEIVKRLPLIDRFVARMVSKEFQEAAFKAVHDSDKYLCGLKELLDDLICNGNLKTAKWTIENHFFKDPSLDEWLKQSAWKLVKSEMICCKSIELFDYFITMVEGKAEEDLSKYIRTPSKMHKIWRESCWQNVTREKMEQYILPDGTLLMDNTRYLPF